MKTTTTILLTTLLTVILTLTTSAIVNAGALAQLIPSPYFDTPIDTALWNDCSPMQNQAEFQEVKLEKPEAQEKVTAIKQDLAFAKTMAQVQMYLGVSPPIRAAAGYECTITVASALKKSLELTQATATETDAEIEKMDFEIGDNFVGPSETLLVTCREAENGVGKLGETFTKLQQSMLSAITNIKNRQAGKVGATVIEIISQDGLNAQLQELTIKLREKQLELKTIVEQRVAQITIETSEIEEKLKEAKKEELQNLDAFYIKQLELTASENIVIDETRSQSPAGLIEESETLLEQAKVLQKTASNYNARGRTANKINNYNSALDKTTVSKTAAIESFTQANAILTQIEEKTQHEIFEAGKIDKPIGKSLITKTISNFKIGETIYDKIQSLNLLTKTLADLRRIYTNNLTEEDKLKLKIEIRSLQRISMDAEAKNVNGASEITSALKSIYALVDNVSNAGELITLEQQMQSAKTILFQLIEDKYKYLREMYANVNELDKQNLFTATEENAVAELRRNFVDNGENIALFIADVNTIEDKMRLLINAASKRITNETITNNTSKNASNIINAIQTSNNNSVDVTSILAQLEEVKTNGVNAFYSTDKTKKSLEQISFENALKVAEQKAKELAKNPTAEKAAEVKKSIDTMNEAITAVQRKASVEIAIAEERGSAPQDASKQWEDGKYTMALQTAQKQNKATLEEATKATGLATASGKDDVKTWAIAGSLVIILIGAAYLFYMKKNPQDENNAL
ncbi:MAG: hypothetical protein V1722_01930 [Candidatus Micrarchaeota archaeon]